MADVSMSRPEKRKAAIHLAAALVILASSPACLKWRIEFGHRLRSFALSAMAEVSIRRLKSEKTANNRISA